MDSGCGRRKVDCRGFSYDEDSSDESDYISDFGEVSEDDTYGRGQPKKGKRSRRGGQELDLYGNQIGKYGDKRTTDYQNIQQDIMRGINIGLNAVAAGNAAVTIVPKILDAVGFSSDGVKSNSVASKWHSSIGNVKSESTFSKCQKTGAGGLSPTANALIWGFAAFCSVAVDLSSNESEEKDEQACEPRKGRRKN